MRTRAEVIRKSLTTLREIYPNTGKVFTGKSYKELKVGDIFVHFKHEKDTDENLINYMYVIKDFVEHTETGEIMVYYQALYGEHKTYVRPAEMFRSPVDKEKYHKIEQEKRMMYLFNDRDMLITDELSVKAIVDFAKSFKTDAVENFITFEGMEYFVDVEQMVVIRLDNNKETKDEV